VQIRRRKERERRRFMGFSAARWVFFARVSR
jgi:hypothetical protein